ncbi:MAG: hypothetical protein NTY35_01220 [Planctomycetota bacterium]|nr:hypothetical protein [Planctomycetota bacterium]
MPPVSYAASLSVLLLAACSPADRPVSPQRTAEVPSDGAAYGGELVLRGEAALLGSGSATIAIVPRGEEAPVMARSWDLGDPAWRSGPDGLRLYFVLDDRDAWAGATRGTRAEMELVARFDPDGNPATEEPGVARVRLPVQAGARDLAIELSVGRQVAVNTGPAGG